MNPVQTHWVIEQYLMTWKKDKQLQNRRQVPSKVQKVVDQLLLRLKLHLLLGQQKVEETLRAENSNNISSCQDGKEGRERNREGEKGGRMKSDVL